MAKKLNFCPTCSSYYLLKGYHANDCNLNPENIIRDILKSRQCVIYMEDNILDRCEGWAKLELFAKDGVADGG